MQQVALEDSAAGDPCDGGELEGTGKGGGGTGYGTIGIGKIGTIGHGSGTGSGYGSGGHLRGSGSKSPTVVEGQSTVKGDLDKAMIRRVVRRHMGRIRFCYERELTKDPKLAAKIAVKFTIGRDGKVTEASSKSSAGGNAELELCLSKAFEAMQFPAPAGGGIVIVAYPLRFEPAPAKP